MSCFTNIACNKTHWIPVSAVMVLCGVMLGITGCSSPSHRQQLDQNVVVLEGKITQLNQEIQQLKAQQQKKIEQQQSTQ